MVIAKSIRAAFGPLCVLLALSASAAEEFRVRLTPVPIDPATRATVTGSGSARATVDGNRLTIAGTFSGLQGPAIAARLHMGPVTAVRGPAIAELTVTHAASGEVNGTVELDPAALDALRAGRLYVQIASEPAPDGNLWGWLLP